MSVVIDRREQLDVLTFVHEYLRTNRPVIIGPALTRHWPVFSRWLTHTSEPRIDWLRTRFGQTPVTVTLCKAVAAVQQATNLDETTDSTKQMTFKQFLTYWQTPNTDDINTTLACRRRFYLKDWHFQRTFPHEPLYSPSPLFQDDWLNRFWDQRVDIDDDYRFVYMGGDGTWTPLHTDVFRSFSWSANICGRKRWTLFPPGEEIHFYDNYGQLIEDIRCVDPHRFPTFNQAKRVVIIQEPGETFLGNTISINHNWLNAANLLPLYQCLKADLKDVRYALRDYFAQMLIMATNRFLGKDTMSTHDHHWDDQVTWRPSIQLCEAELCMRSFTLEQLLRVINELLDCKDDILVVDQFIVTQLINSQKLLIEQNNQNV
ncbi:hypothetical protein BDF19DRAFT_419007 [Syncephalis fuscata]|nr:hypothetical protein BDF19DRAFT_419007 [Syncephalis fuscata]